jgi:hypothetical protein
VGACDGPGDDASTWDSDCSTVAMDSLGTWDRPCSGQEQDGCVEGLRSPLSEGTLPSPGDASLGSTGPSPWGYKLHSFGGSGASDAGACV